MAIIEERKEFYTEVKGIDNNGGFVIQIQNDCSQLRVRTPDEFISIDLDSRNLSRIASIMNAVVIAYHRQLANEPTPQ